MELLPTMESMEKPSLDLEAELETFAELELAAATAAAATAAAAAALWGKVTDIMGGSAAKVILFGYFNCGNNCQSFCLLLKIEPQF